MEMRGLIIGIGAAGNKSGRNGGKQGAAFPELFSHSFSFALVNIVKATPHRDCGADA